MRFPASIVLVALTAVASACAVSPQKPAKPLRVRVEEPRALIEDELWTQDLTSPGSRPNKCSAFVERVGTRGCTIAVGGERSRIVEGGPMVNADGWKRLFCDEAAVVCGQHVVCRCAAGEANSP